MKTRLVLYNDNIYKVTFVKYDSGHSTEKNPP